MLKGFLVVAALVGMLVSSALGMAAPEEPEEADRDLTWDVGLDPGHSDADVGAAGGGLREADLALDVALRVRAMLEQRGLAVAMTRLDHRPVSDFSERDPTERIRLEQEARIAAAGQAGIYVSIHFNGYGDPRVRGAETYYNGDNRGEESRLLAGALHRNLLAEVRATGYALPDRGVKEDLAAGKPYGHFFSLRGGMPSALVESMFLSNPAEAALLAEDEMREAVARGVAKGIWEHLRGDAPWDPYPEVEDP